MARTARSAACAGRRAVSAEEPIPGAAVEPAISQEAAVDIIFGAMGHVAWYQECARSALIFFYGLLLVRLAGRRIFGRWSALDIVVSIVIGSNLSRAITGTAPLWGTLAASALLVGLHWVLANFASRYGRFSRLVEGRAVDLARDGMALVGPFHRRLVSEADLGEALRQAGIDNLAHSRRVTLEPSGKISVLKA
jgi:uncharacterized membrane protein YcaP (DUF421 family)